MQVYNVDINNTLIEKLKTIDGNTVHNPLENDMDTFTQLIEETVGYKVNITNNWFNRTTFTGVGNGFDWHNEKGIGGNHVEMSGTHAGILWIDGSVNQGGELQILANDTVKTVNFEPGKLIVFESDTMHKVLHYNGTSPRTSINVTMFCGDDNGN